MTEYFVADSYKGFELIGEPYLNKAGKMVTIARCKCDRCIKGIFVTRIENGQPVPHPAYGGVCLKCGGKGYIQKEIRLYTKAEYDTMQRNNERTRQRKAEAAEAKRLAEFDTKKAKWLSDNGFNAEGNTYLYIKEDSYQIKDELKAAGYKYNPMLKWHGPTAGEFEDATEAHNVEEFYELTAWGTYVPYADAKSKVESIIRASRPVSTSEWIGSVGDRLKNIPVTLVGIYPFEGKYGMSQIVKFNDESGNQIIWFTSVDIQVEVGECCFLSGTIKKLSEYKGVKNTIVTRCKVK